jgi:hypothetical protein
VIFGGGGDVERSRPLAETVQLEPVQGTMNCIIRWPALPGEQFRLNLPEAIANNEGGRWGVNEIKPQWVPGEGGTQSYDVTVPKGMRLQIEMAPSEDHVDIRYRVTNLQAEDWTESLAFTCFNLGAAPSFSDFDMRRTYVWRQGQAFRLVDIERKFSTRPLVQLFGIEGARPWTEVPFVTKFHASPPDPCEPLIGIRSRDGRRTAAVASNPALFLFHNGEYSCIHSCPTLGPLEAGHTGEAMTRLYFLEASIDPLHHRYRDDFA